MGFVYTPDQKEVIDFLREQLKPEGLNVVVSGAGGVGKTAMVCEFISELLVEGYRVAVSAMTGKATAVLRSKIFDVIKEKKIKIEKGALLIETISKLTKESKVLSLTESGETLYSNTWKSPESFGNNFDVLFIDELSMVPHFVAQWWGMSGVRVFGFGDACQLPEVSTAETKKEIAGFRHDIKPPTIKYQAGYGIKVLKGMAQKELHKVLRSDNEIALLCGELRDFKQSKEEFMGRFKSWAAKTDNIQYSTSKKDIPGIDEINDWQIICYTNKLCKEINDKFAIGGDYPDPIDRIMILDNINSLQVYNGDAMLFTTFLHLIDQYNKTHKRKVFVVGKWQGKMPRKDSPHTIERNFFRTYVNFKRAIDDVNHRRMLELPGIIRSSGFAEEQKENWIKDLEGFKEKYLDEGECYMNIIREFENVNLDAAQYISEMSTQLPRLHVVGLDYAYCSSTHKSQGSEYENVCYIAEKFDKSLIYTGTSRAKKKLRMIDLTS